jgi:diadenylate cyclase
MAIIFGWLKQVFQDFTIADVFDILVVALGIFFLLRLVRGTRAVQLIKGFVAVMLLVAGAKLLSLTVTHWLFSVILQNWVITLIVLFQPELRLVIEQLGRGKFLREAFRPAANQDLVAIINEVVRASRRLSEKKIGALVAIEREVGLNDIISTGRRIGGSVSSELLQTIFHPGGPMHDGGVVISHFQVAAAMCLFPLTSRDDSPRSYGTRHRAAIGLSEVTDAVIVVVSEETGTISLAVEGELISNLSVGGLKEKLLALLQPAPAEGHRPFWRREPPPKTPEGDGVASGEVSR